jgi:hypothetical protein
MATLRLSWTSRLSPCGHPLLRPRYASRQTSARTMLLHNAATHIIQRAATGSPKGDSKGTEFKTPAAPATVSGEPSATCHWDVQSPEKAAGTALTREPGDLPDAVVLRPDRVCRVNEDVPRATTALPRRSGRAAYALSCALGVGWAVCPRDPADGVNRQTKGTHHAQYHPFDFHPLSVCCSLSRHRPLRGG